MLSEVHQHALTLSRPQWLEAWQEHAKTGRDDLPGFPPEDIQRITNNQAGAATMAAAAPFASIVEDETRERLDDPGELRLLDYGAGWGRITRLLLRPFRPENITAVDVDDRLVTAGQELLSGVDFRLIESGEPLPFDDDAFDVVIANSVFSHLSEDLHVSTVAELGRVTRSGGLLLLTTLTPKHYRGWQQKAETQAWTRGVLGDPEQVNGTLGRGEFAFGPTGRWPDYGLAIIPDGWIGSNWPSRTGLDLIGVRDDYSQQVNLASPS